MKLFAESIGKWADLIGYSLVKLTIVPTVICMGTMTLVVLLGVVFRYLFRSPLGWTEDLARYLMIWSALLSVSICIYYKEHVGISILLRKLPLPVAKILRTLTNLLIVYFLYILIGEGYKMAVRGKMQIVPSLKISMYWPLMAVPVSASLAIIQQSLQIITDIFKTNSIAELVGETAIEEIVQQKIDKSSNSLTM